SFPLLHLPQTPKGVLQALFENFFVIACKGLWKLWDIWESIIRTIFIRTGEATFLEQDTPMAAKNSISGFLFPGNLVGESSSPIPRCSKSSDFAFWLHSVSQRLCRFQQSTHPGNAPH
ncbi:MAG: hypothetical protein IJI45_09480, partial [Anaerolineaceae bacterium]|nr:hypothetical protein [Anaerolineaceae bacterium]